MRRIGRRFRFTIGQGMVVIALLAVAFAIMPMPAAIVLAFLTTGLIVLRRNRPPKPTALYESVGCIFFFGVLAGVVLLRQFLPPALAAAGATNVDYWTDGLALLAIVGAFIAGILGQAWAAAIFRRPSLPPEAADPDFAETRAELKLVENLLRRAQEDGDEVVISKLTEYRGKLAHELQASASDP